MTIRELMALFEAELATFADASPVLASRVWCEIRWRPDSARARDYAYELNGKIVLYREICRLPDENVIGIIRHELGHAFDPFDEYECAEARADDIARAVTGHPIRYDARGVQTIGPGGFRPRRLRC